ncbi:lantibiotic dehydratase family protein [Bacteroides fragilis]|uniref:lantibiotic dehydratase family protein n=1 Tax=Bacteroides fragilis TaxID=817 RepID=UPI00202FC10E|nr:lantibiotic dehydratase family protein [Bacteroides fragilis]MCM0315725.1 lantibiotic dehydratase family protein [Bacteroides fragilis]
MKFVYRAFDTVIVRVPLISFNLLKDYLSRDSQFFVLKDELVLESIFLASPELYKEVVKVLSKKTFNYDNKLLYTLTRYYSRMCTRCTPFGLFAGCAIATIGDDSILSLSDNIFRSTRFDMFFLYLLYQEIVKVEEVKQSLLYRMNSSMYSIGHEYRYVNYYYSPTRDRRIYQISSIKKYHFLDILYKEAQDEKSIDYLVSLIYDDFTTKDYAKEIIEGLIDNQILVDTLEPNIIGTDAFLNLVNKVNNIMPNSKICIFLNKLKILLDSLDKELNAKERIAKYKEIIGVIDNYKIQIDKKYLFQVDSYRNTLKSTISKRVINELKTVILFLSKITPKVVHANLNTFKEAFYIRYENMEVPLLNVLDPESGIGYPVNQIDFDVTSPLLNNFKVPARAKTVSIELEKNEQILLDKILSALRDNEREVELLDDDFVLFEGTFDDLPSTLFTLFELLQDDGNQLLLKLNSVGSSAANIISRFAYLKPEIENMVRLIAETEQKKMNDFVLAEIVHLPNDRVGNILSRPHLRDFEILYLANSEEFGGQKILASDILVSIKNNRLMLRSKSLNRYIMPRLSNAHNFIASEIPFYRLLCDIQSYENKDFFHVFHFLDRMLKYKPRIKYRNTILSPETWIIDVADIAYIFSLENITSKMEVANEWRRKNVIPRYVLLSDADNNLFVDFESCLSLEAFWAIIKNRKSIRLCEFIFDEEVAIINDSKSRVYRNECIVALYKD